MQKRKKKAEEGVLSSPRPVGMVVTEWFEMGSVGEGKKIFAAKRS